MKKILIIYASAGDGHKKAAEAVYSAFLELKRDDVKVVPIDSLNYTNRFFKYCYKIGYMIVIKYVPTLWGLVYHILDNKFFCSLNKPVRRAFNALNTKRLVQFLVNESFDVAISTHFLGTEVISSLKNRGVLSLPLINIITDFKPHFYWQVKGVDNYIVAAETTKDELIKRGVETDRIKVLGIPIRKRFNSIISREEARERLKVYADKFTILVMGGGFGVGPIEEVVLRLQRLDFDCQIIVVCGHNKKLFQRLNLLKGSFKKPIYILGFCRNVEEIMVASNVMISKVGGITVAETLSKGLPVLAINPIPGQEMRNASFLFENSIGFKLKGVSEINDIIREFFYSPEKVDRLKENIQKLARPHAARDIAQLAVSIRK